MKHNWEYKRLGDVCKIVNGFAFKSELFKDSGMPILRIANIQNDTITTDALVFCNPSDYKTDLSKFLVKSDDLVMALSGATTGKIGINKTNIEFYLNQRVALFKDILISRRYLFYFLKTEGKNILESAFGVAQPNVSTSKLTELYIPVPTQNVQERIVAELDKINETIEDCRELLRNLDALAQSLFYDFFGDPNINPKGWEMRKFAEVCDTFTDGDWIESKDQSTDGFRLIQTGNIGEGIYLDKSERSKFISADTFYSLKCKEVFEGDILISRLPDPIGRACILPKLPLRSITAVDCTIVRPKSFILPNFLLQYTLTDAYYNSLSSITKGATRKRVSRGNLGKVLIPVPPISLQEQFAARIEQIEVQKKAVEQTIAELQTLLDSRMDYYFG